ncbi:MAG TPA: hypothetical protein VGR96_02775 [Acidobacteriaceae bacterium]|nr:hypothetical protein [Acidobacteriaceae bacterium]
MAISVLAVLPNQSFPPNLASGGLTILSGVVECVFKGSGAGDVVRDTLTFTVGRVNLGTGVSPIASCVMSLASFAFDGPVTDALWAVDSASVPAFVNLDRGSGTADLEVVGNLAVRGANGIILRVNYIVFYVQS